MFHFTATCMTCFMLYANAHANHLGFDQKQKNHRGNATFGNELEQKWAAGIIKPSTVTHLPFTEFSSRNISLLIASFNII